MPNSLYQRLEGKGAEDALIERIAATFNLAPIFARTYFEEIRRLFAEHFQIPEAAGTLVLHVIAAAEPAGKPLAECRKVPVRLTLEAPGDLDVWRTRGLAALRQGKLLRLTHETLEQDGLLTQEDLARILCCSISTVKRDAEALRHDGFAVPTRGAIQDIGPGVSHKARIVELYLQSFSFAELERRSRHSKRAIERYLTHFTQVARLTRAGHPAEEIRLITGLSARVVEQYLALLEQHRNSWRLKELLEPPAQTRPGTPQYAGSGRPKKGAI
jgi:hypothetical protein